MLWRGLAQGVEHDLRVEAYDHVQHLDLGLARDAARRARRSPRSTTTSTSSSGSSTSGRRRSSQTALNVLLVGAVFAAASWQLLVFAFLPIPLIVIGSLRLPASARAALRPGPGRGRRPVRRALRQPRRHRDDQGVHRRGPRARPRRRPCPLAYRRRQHRRDPVVGRVRAAGPDGDPGRLHLHAAARRLGDAARRPRGRPLLGAGLHDPAPALAADRGRRGARPLPARPRLDRPHPGACSQVPVTVPAGATALARPVARPRRAARRTCRLRRRARRPARHRPRRARPARPTRSSGATGVGQVVAAAPGAALRRPPRRAGAARRARTCASLDWDSLRGSIGYVAQDVLHVRRHRSADNIAYGRPDATREQMRRGRRGGRRARLHRGAARRLRHLGGRARA